MDRIGIVGAGTMGHGIAQVCAMAGYQVYLVDSNEEILNKATVQIQGNLTKGVDRGKVSPEDKARALDGLHTTTEISVMAKDADWVIEAIPEQFDWKVTLFKEIETHAPSHCIFGSNTSSLSITKLSEHLQDPSRLIGTHFFNPVHIMALLELVISQHTRSDVVDAAVMFGERIGKEVIQVQDVPGFATSRLGVCLGMEAIRMVEDGVASAEDIDKAMVLGYRHPIGPLRLTDLVGLDVRLAIGEYLAKELGNPAFEPPPLMRKMVSDGFLGKKSGKGFYSW